MSVNFDEFWDGSGRGPIKGCAQPVSSANPKAVSRHDQEMQNALMRLRRDIPDGQLLKSKCRFIVYRDQKEFPYRVASAGKEVVEIEERLISLGFDVMSGGDRSYNTPASYCFIRFIRVDTGEVCRLPLYEGVHSFDSRFETVEL